jgi:hypothetical protein
MGAQSISDAFAVYDAKLKNPNWSVSAWAPDGSLVVSMWEHHYRKGPSGSVEYVDRVSRWAGNGNKEFRRNISEAFTDQRSVRLVGDPCPSRDLANSRPECGRRAPRSDMVIDGLLTEAA